MIQTLELEQTANAEQDTWILKLPDEICRKEGLAEGTMVSLTIQSSGIQATFIKPPSEKIREASARLLRKNREAYEELKRLGD